MPIHTIGLADDDTAQASERASALFRLKVSNKPVPEVESRFFDSNGVKIHYKIFSEQGDPVILVHGFSARIATQWITSGVLQELLAENRVIAIDNRGHGLSDKPHEAEAYGTEMVDDIVRLMDHLGIERAHVVGYSMGGFITGKFLTTYPDRLISATMGGAGWGRVELNARTNMLEDLATSLEEGRGFGPLINGLTPEGEPPVTEQEMAMINAYLSMGNDMLALAAAIRGMTGLFNTEEDLRAVDVPVLALIGEVDPLKTGVDALDGVLPTLQIVVIPGADHAGAFREDLFVAELKTFLAEHAENAEHSENAENAEHSETEALAAAAQ